MVSLQNIYPVRFAIHAPVVQTLDILARKGGVQQPVMHGPAVDIFQKIAVELDTEGRYLFLNALANQLRFPNNHTHYFSCVLLYLFAEAKQVRHH